MKPSEPIKRRKLIILLTASDTIHLLRNQIPYLSKEYDIVVVSGTGKDPSCMSNIKRISKTITIPISRGINVLADCLSIALFMLIIAAEKPLIVHSYTPKAGLIAAIASWAMRVPVRVHSFTGLIFPTSKGLKRTICTITDLIILNLSTRPIAESLGVQRDLISISARKTYLLGKGSICGVDTEYFKTHANAGARQGIFKVLYIGRLAADKGISTLITALADVNSGRTKRFHLTIAGDKDRRDPITPEDMMLIKESPDITYISHSDDVRTLLKRSDILVLPSLREGFPNVLLESFAMNLPAISSKVSGAEDLITPGVTGWLVKPGSQKSLAEALLIAESLKPEEIIEMGAKCREVATNYYDTRTVNSNLSKFYRDAIRQTTN